ncbi:MAG: Flp pilus assembly protein CpaB [Zhengella sp.]|uniref:Flp pilus assembly protein CpaB n=1 Tax=Zhengella sp. TaxID=2282762 RepID=UPI001D93A0DE|nr:Flp pilus assembly protein CpaB [Notoacmeibacter sp.]MCC0025607.1 Flp pilus assembly protein CpaB [Brucellaceae bacterium]
MKSSQLIVLGVAVAAAGGAGMIAKNMVSAPPPEPAVMAPVPAEPAIALAEILVVTEDMPVGAPIEGQLRWQEWPVDAMNPEYITRSEEPDAIDKLAGVAVRTSMSAGEPLRKTRLVGFGKSFMSSILPSGKRAIATQISADTSAGGFILPNDFVDVIMTRRSNSGTVGEGFKTETILRNIRVLAIDQTIQEDEEGRKVKVGETATLELTPQQAEIITVAQQMADRLTLALRSVEDADEIVEGSADYLVSSDGDRSGVVRMIKGGELSEEATKK